MYIPADTLDDLLRRIFEKLLRSKNHINPTRGPARELTGVLLKITHPRARLSRTEKKGRLFSALGELLWYLAKTNDVRFVSYYVGRYKKETDDGKTIWGGYGPRLFDMKRIGLKGIDQLANVVELLKRNPDSRRAVVQLFDASDIAKKHTDIPCTCTLQFMIRRQRLHMLTNMRSNDAFIGLPHDIFAFTMLQEIMARELHVEMGAYKQTVGSLHLYDQDRASAMQYLKEGWQETVFMPEMPVVEPWPSIKVLLRAESLIRRGKSINIRRMKLHRYWKDLVRLLQIYAHFKNNDGKKIGQLKRGMSVRIYDPYIEQKKRIANRRAATVEPIQQPLL